MTDGKSSIKSRPIEKNRNPGIYRLQFSTGHYYIGSSIDYVKRCRQHQNNMRRGAHDSPRVQNVYNKHNSLPIYGLVVACSVDELEQTEQRFLDEHVSMPLCLNISRCAEAATRGLKFKPHTEEFKRYMSEKMRNRVFTEEHRRRISESKKGQPMDATRTPEAIAKRSASLRGKKVSDKTRAAISKTLLGHKPAFSKPVVLLNTMETFESALLAERVTGAAAIGRACRHGYSAGKMPDGTPMRWSFAQPAVTTN